MVLCFCLVSFEHGGELDVPSDGNHGYLPALESTVHVGATLGGDCIMDRAIGALLEGFLGPFPLEIDGMVGHRHRKAKGDEGERGGMSGGSAVFLTAHWWTAISAHVERQEHRAASGRDLPTSKCMTSGRLG